MIWCFICLCFVLIVLKVALFCLFCGCVVCLILWFDLAYLFVASVWVFPFAALL